MKFKLFNSCPFKTANLIKKIFIMCKKDGLKLVRFDELEEQVKVPVPNHNMYCSAYHPCEGCKIIRNCSNKNMAKVSQITTILEFS